MACRTDLVKTRRITKGSRIDAAENEDFTRCFLSGEELVEPITICKKGRLYNKETVMKALLQNTNPLIKHIKSLKQVSKIKCTLTGDEPSKRKKKFYLLWNCGCVYSDLGISLLADECCVKCQTPYTLKVPILPHPFQVPSLA